ncbi:MAG: hypothetical protein LAO79_07655 [Acidobacteriia bacterium]|nr:hypothetical protein [Terriglobia bacterium]
MHRKPLILALAAVAVWFSWQALTVRVNYGGNWTALFCTRGGLPVPQFLKSENLYRFHGTEGYDGQIFHLIAHDPWMTKGSYQAISGAAFRYQRILVPALAWTLALGDDRRVHAAYFAVILGFLFLGVYWTARFAASLGLAPAWGLIFAVTPAAIASIDRMVADVALAALTAGFALYAAKGRWPVFVILACAALTRETALPIIGGYTLFLMAQKRWRGALLAAASVLPMIAWYFHVSHGRSSTVIRYVGWIPLAGFFERIVHPAVYELGGWHNTAGQVFDYLALAGVGLALIFTVRFAVRREWSELAAALYGCFAAVLVLKSRDVWEDAYAFGRVLTPFMLLAMLVGIAHQTRRRPWLAALPLLMVSARLTLNLTGQFLGIVHSLGLSAALLPALLK